MYFKPQFWDTATQVAVIIGRKEDNEGENGKEKANVLRPRWRFKINCNVPNQFEPFRSEFDHL